jgi:2-C-methyl-D-erythritol 4-phosphate cytidylyltransferase
VARFAVILPAAGKSSRFGGPDKKPFVTLEGRPIWLRTAELFVTRPDVCQVLLVVAPDDLDLFRSRYAANLAFLDVRLAPGGVERFESVANALAMLSSEADFVAVHDAVRPCATSALIDAVFAETIRHGAALAAVAVTDTVKRSADGQTVEATLPRGGLWLAQTPQAARRDWFESAYAARARLGRNITDDAQLLEAAGHPVRLVPGAATNLKITTRADLALAETLLKSRPQAKAPRPIHPFADEEGRW